MTQAEVTPGADPAAAGMLIRRKLGRAVADRDASRGPVAQALRLALGRMARASGDMPLAVTNVSAAHMSLGEVLELALPGMYVAIVEDAQDRMGVALLDSDLASALVEFLTSGQIVAEAPPPCKPTRTDAALVGPALDMVLAHFDDALEAMPDGGWARGFRGGSFLDHPRPLGLILEDLNYSVLVAELAPTDPDASARGGRWCLALPEAAPMRQTRNHDMPVKAMVKTGDPAAPESTWRARLEATVMGCPADLTAVLSRQKLSLSDALALAPGSMLELPMSALEQIRVESPDRRVVALARLGQARGHRALRLLRTADDPLHEDYPESMPARDAPQIADPAASTSVSAKGPGQVPTTPSDTPADLSPLPPAIA